MDSSGNIYTTGVYTGKANFSGGSATDYLIRTGGGFDAFVSKLNSSGQYAFADDLGTGDDDTFATGIAVDSSGNVYTTGYFQGKGNFGGASGNHTVNSTGAGQNAYVSKLTTNGMFGYVVDLGGGSTNAQGVGIAVDGSGSVYTTGTFSGTGNFDGGSGNTNLTSSNSGNDTNAYVSKLNPGGQFVYATDLRGEPGCPCRWYRGGWKGERLYDRLIYRHRQLWRQFRHR